MHSVCIVLYTHTQDRCVWPLHLAVSTATYVISAEFLCLNLSTVCLKMPQRDDTLEDDATLLHLLTRYNLNMPLTQMVFTVCVNPPFTS